MSLEEAVCKGHLRAAKKALLNCSDVNRRGSKGFSPLMVASGLGHAQIVKLLLGAGADPHIMEPQMGATALHKASQCGNADVIGLLIDHGAFVDQQSPILGNTPLIDAVLHKHEAAVRLLLDRGARTSICNHWQQSALQLARADGLSSLAHIIELRDAADAQQLANLALIAAVKTGDPTEVKRSIEAGVDLNQRVPIRGGVDDDYTPLGVAVREQRTAMVSLLLDSGADPKRVIGLMRGTVMHEASFFGFSEVLHVLLRRLKLSADLSTELGAQGPYNGFTPLHDAVWHGHLGAVQLLIGAGAPLWVRTHTGLTPRELAMQYGFVEVMMALADAEGVSEPPCD